MQRTDTPKNVESTDEPLVSDLREAKEQIEAVNDDARSLTAGLSDAQFNWRPAPGKWSIAECIDHLTVTGRVSVLQIHQTIADARSRDLLSRGPFNYGMLGNILVRSMGPKPKLKFKAPKIFKPKPDRPLAEVTSDFFAIQDELLACIHSSNGIDLARAKVTSPITKLLKLSLGQEFALLIAHERRHLWQARQVSENLAFPPS